MKRILKSKHTGKLCVYTEFAQITDVDVNSQANASSCAFMTHTKKTKYNNESHWNKQTNIRTNKERRHTEQQKITNRSQQRLRFFKQLRIVMRLQR